MRERRVGFPDGKRGATGPALLGAGSDLGKGLYGRAKALRNTIQHATRDTSARLSADT
jgi:hypothetical protein